MKLNSLHLLSFAIPLVLATGAEAAARAARTAGPAVARLELSPPSLRLDGKGDSGRVFVTAVLADGRREDVTDRARFQAASRTVAVGAGGQVRALRDGSGQVRVRFGTRSVLLPVQVSRASLDRPVSFVYDVLPILSRAGCNQGSCHGNAEGRGGFRLSLKGEDPLGDHAAIATHGGGRRIHRSDPGASLLLLKGTAAVAHGGGRRFAPDSEEARTLAGWIAAGGQPDPPSTPRLTRLEVSPRERILVAPARMQRLTVVGHFSDGTARSLADRAFFSPGDPSVSVTPDGKVSVAGGADVAVLVRYADRIESARLTFVPARPAFSWKPVPEQNWIDTVNFRRLRALRLQPSEPATDEQFLRRAYLDAIGTLPTPEEARAFLAECRSGPGSRAAREKLIDRLLQRPEFDDLWTMRWSDVLRVEERTLDPKGARAYRDWIRASIAGRKPLDRFARELLTGTGSTYANPPANYYRRSRTPDDLAETTAQVFMGTRMLCAKCHNHPFERWKQDDYYSLAAFFARVERKVENLTRKDRFDLHEIAGEEMIGVAEKGEVRHPRTREAVAPGLPSWLPAVDTAALQPDPRAAFARWLTAPENPFFAKATANRIWYHLMGRGLVDPVDDLRESNPAAHPELLDGLAKELVRSGYDLRHLVRIIMSSRTYQLSADPNGTNAEDERFFSRAIPVRLPAEVLLDAISQVAGVPESLPENATGGRAINLIPVNKQKHPFLTLFGRPARESACECERTNETTLGQSFALISGTAIDGKLKHPENRIGKLLAAGRSDRELVTELYLATVSREPAPRELELMLKHLAAKGDRRAALEDALWALINSKEFLLRR